MNVDIFWRLVGQLLPLYALIAAGFVMGRYGGVQRESVANLLIYLVAPLVFFESIATTAVDRSNVVLLFITFALATALSLAFLKLSGFWIRDSRKNLIAFISGTGNTGYFGIPLFIMFFSEKNLGVYMLAVFGLVVWESLVGYYLIARGVHSVRESVYRLIRLPLFYAALLGLIFSWGHAAIHPSIREMAAHFRSIYIVLGMMMIGLGLATMKQIEIDWLFIGWTFFARFIATPIAVCALIALDLAWLHILSATAYKSLFVFAIVPIAANSVLYAAQMRLHPEKAATAVLFSTLFCLIYIPIVYSLFETIDVF